MVRSEGAFLTADETDDSDLPAILNMENAGLVCLSADASSEDLDRLSLEQAISLLKADRKVYLDLKKQGRADTAGFRLHLQAEEPQYREQWRGLSWRFMSEAQVESVREKQDP